MTVWGFGEVLLRYTPPDYQTLEAARNFNCYIGGAELNTISTLSRWGHATEMLTHLPDNAMGQLAMNHIRTKNIGTNHVSREDGRIGTYYLEEGYGNRSGAVIYDRTNSVFALKGHTLLHTNQFKQGDYFVFTGITLAVNQELQNQIVTYLTSLKNMGVTIVFDINFRENLWTKDVAVPVIARVLPLVDILMCGKRDATELLKTNVPEDSMLYCAKTLQQKYDIAIVASSNRDVAANTLQGLMISENGNVYQSETYPYYVLNRIGAGDAFLAGMLHGLINEWSHTDIVTFATKCGVLQHTTQEDALNIPEEKVHALTSYTGEIQR